MSDGRKSFLQPWEKGVFPANQQSTLPVQTGLVTELVTSDAQGMRPHPPEHLPTGPRKSRFSRPPNNNADKSDDADKGNEQPEPEICIEESERDDGNETKSNLQAMKDLDKKDGCPYSGIPPERFYCHVCKTRMPDDQSFSKHLKGRAHVGAMKLRNELYLIQANLIKNDIQIEESLRNIETDRLGKKPRNISQEYCSMCNVHLDGSLIAHRKREKHRFLTKFLHPRCDPCGKEFRIKILLDEHKLSPEHMQKCTDLGDDMMIDATIPLDDFELDDLAKEEISTYGIETEYSCASFRRFVPRFNPDETFALKMVVPAEGYECSLCKAFFYDEETASIHCRSLIHYNNYVADLKRKEDSDTHPTMMKPLRGDQETGDEPKEFEEGVDKAECSSELGDSVN